MRGILSLIPPIVGTLLAACTSPVTDRFNAGPNSYETLSSTAAVTSTLGGIAAKLPEGATRATVSRLSGSLTHNTGRTVIDDGTYRLVDTDGIDAGGLLTDGISAAVASVATGSNSRYDYLRVYRQAYLSGARPVAVTGIYGIQTRAADMPTAGSAVYGGAAFGDVKTQNDTFDLTGGSARVQANFASGAVTVQMQGLRASNRNTGASAQLGFDGVEVNNMQVSGSTLSGGTVTLRNGTAAVSPLGAQQSQSAEGAFFGQDSTGAPDEVGGIAYVTGASGALTAVFIAD